MAETSFDLPDPFANADDLAAYWQSLTEAEKTRANNLLKWAAKIIIEQPGSEDFDPVVCAMISMDMVKRAMLNGDGVSDTTTSQTMADMSASVTSRYVNPAGNLYLLAQEANRLAGRFGGTAGSLTLTSNVRVPREPWNQQPADTDAGT